MKSKRRHELQTNELADRIGHAIQVIRPYTTMILTATTAVAIVVCGWYVWNAWQERQQGEAWQAMFNASTDPQADLATEFTRVASQYADTSAGLWATQTAADMHLAQGVRLLFSDRALADTSLTMARDRYLEVVQNEKTAAYPMLLERARFGLAQTLETMNELDQAKKYYSLVTEANSDSVLGQLAKTRLERLGKPEVAKWYHWFARQKPAPPPEVKQPSAAGGAGLGDVGPSLGDLPDTPEEAAAPDAKAGTESPAAKPADKNPAETTNTKAPAIPAAKAPQPNATPEGSKPASTESADPLKNKKTD